MRYVLACTTLTGYMRWAVPARGDSCPLIQPHFKNCRTLTMDSFIDIVGHNWPRNAGLRSPLQHTVTQRGLPPRWPQLSQVEWFSEKNYIYHAIKRRFPATLYRLDYIVSYNNDTLIAEA